MDNIKVIEGLFDQKKIKVLKLFLNNSNKEFYLREIAQITNVPPATTYRILNKLIILKLISMNKISKFKLYRLAENDSVKFLESFLKESMQLKDYYVNAISKVAGVQSIILHGQEIEDRANILIIGENVNNQQLKEIAAELKEKYKYTLSYLVLAKEQYEQMSNMGLYSGKKKVLFRRNM